jgi:hypothetical protein
METPPAPTHARPVKTFVCKNKRCGATLGATDGENLFLRGVIVPFNPHFIKFDCPGCGGTVEWRKLPKNKKLLT